MPDAFYSVDDIKELMQAFNKFEISELKVESGAYKLEIIGVKGGQATVSPVSAPQSTAAVEPHAPEYGGKVVKSPIVGTFYASSAPDREPFVSVGSRIMKGDVLFIIESMKLMNEVVSEYEGVVAEIFVKNAQGVEYGQPIMRLE